LNPTRARARFATHAGVEPLSRRLCLITGASAGIGAAFARVYAGQGWDVALTARRAERLAALADEIRLRWGVETLVLPMDITDPSAPERLVGEIEAQGRTVDGLVNNAGYSTITGFAETAWSEHQALLQAMLLAPTELMHRVLPSMLDARFGRIVNICSLAGLLPATPGGALYGPVKGYLIKLSQSLHLELREQGVHVTALCPGYTYSEFHDVNGTRDKVSKSYPDWIWMGADEVARAGWEAGEANRALSVPGAPNKAIAALAKLIPDDWALQLAARHAARLGRL
jgi:short-subunit dehydrogenase